jgi:hypothetical protein
VRESDRDRESAIQNCSMRVSEQNSLSLQREVVGRKSALIVHQLGGGAPGASSTGGTGGGTAPGASSTAPVEAPLQLPDQGFICIQ